MGYQFIHVETYGRAAYGGSGWTMRDIANEALRVDGACNHVENPVAPTRIFGDCDIIELVDEIENDAETSFDVFGRKLRKDAQLMLAGVASYPVHVNELKSSAAEYIAWRKRVVSFLQEEYGGNLKCVYQHLDEQYPHVHFYVRAIKNGNNLDLGKLHPGRFAASNRKLTPKDRRRLYKEAMKDYQNRYFEKVGRHSGMTRLGPKKRRLSREQWKSEQESAKVFDEFEDMKRRLAESLKLIEEMKHEIDGRRERDIEARSLCYVHAPRPF